MIYDEFTGDLAQVLKWVVNYFQSYNPSGYGTTIDQCRVLPDNTVWVRISRYSSSD